MIELTEIEELKHEIEHLKKELLLRDKEIIDTKDTFANHLILKFGSKLKTLFSTEKLSSVIGFSKYFENTYCDGLKPHHKIIDDISFISHVEEEKNITLEFLIPDISYNSVNGNLNNMYYLREHIKNMLELNIRLDKKLFFKNFKVSVHLYLKKELTVDLDNLSLVSLLINKYIVDYFKGVLYVDDKSLIKLDFKTITNNEKKHRLVIKIS